MRIVTAGAVRLFERLVLVRILQGSVFHIVAIDAERRSRFGQMEIKLGLSDLANLVRNVAGVAAHIESGVAAAFLRNIQSLLMAIEAEILSSIA